MSPDTHQLRFGGGRPRRLRRAKTRREAEPIRMPPGMSMYEWLEREWEATPRVVRAWLRLTRPIRPANLKHTGLRIAWAAQRARHGIGAGDAADLDHYLTRVSARGLRQLHAWSHTYPQGRTAEAWQAEILHAATALEDWLAITSETSGVDDDEARAELDRRREDALSHAKDAMRWIADNLDDLWD